MGTTSEKLNYLAQTKADIKSAIEAKGVTVPDGTTFRQYATKIGDIVSGGDIVNGVIEQYKAATTTVSANTFVEFIGSLKSSTATTLVSSTASDTDDTIYAVALSGSKVFLTYGIIEGPYSSSNHLYGVICTISNGAITVGTPMQISSVAGSGAHPQVGRISSTQALVAYSAAGTKIYGNICTVTDDTIVVGAQAEINAAVTGMASIAMLSSSKAFIAFSRYDTGSTTYGVLSGVICDISGTTITAGYAKTLTTISPRGGREAIAVAISNDKVAVVFNGEDTYDASRLYGIVCSVSGTSFTTGTATKLSNTTYGGYGLSAVKVSDGVIFVAHNGGTSYSLAASRLYGVVCTISDTTITAGSDTLLSSTTYGGAATSSLLVSDGEVLVIHNGDGATNSGNAHVYGTVCSISGATITTSTDMLLSTTNRGSRANNDADRTIVSMLLGGQVLTIYKGVGTDYPLYAITPYEKSVQPTVSKIEGLTKTECTTATAGDVWVFSGN